MRSGADRFTLSIKFIATPQPEKPFGVTSRRKYWLRWKTRWLDNPSFCTGPADSPGLFLCGNRPNPSRQDFISHRKYAAPAHFCALVPAKSQNLDELRPLLIHP